MNTANNFKLKTTCMGLGDKGRVVTFVGLLQKIIVSDWVETSSVNKWHSYYPAPVGLTTLFRCYVHKHGMIAKTETTLLTGRACQVKMW